MWPHLQAGAGRTSGKTWIRLGGLTSWLAADRTYSINHSARRARKAGHQPTRWLCNRVGTAMHTASNIGAKGLRRVGKQRSRTARPPALPATLHEVRQHDQFAIAQQAQDAGRGASPCCRLPMTPTLTGSIGKRWSSHPSTRVKRDHPFDLKRSLSNDQGLARGPSLGSRRGDSTRSIRGPSMELDLEVIGLPAHALAPAGNVLAALQQEASQGGCPSAFGQAQSQLERLSSDDLEDPQPPASLSDRSA